VFDLDAHIGIHAEALRLRALRGELLANNLANADTPGYKARDIDFRTALAAAAPGGGNLPLSTTRSGHIAAGPNAATAGAQGVIQYRVPMAPALDGNTVDAQVEQASFAENAVRYQATLSFLNARFRSLMTAITGQ
jgi:flagellar basal-body rod protein FlgB